MTSSLYESQLRKTLWKPDLSIKVKFLTLFAKDKRCHSVTCYYAGFFLSRYFLGRTSCLNKNCVPFSVATTSALYNLLNNFQFWYEFLIAWPIYHFMFWFVFTWLLSSESIFLTILIVKPISKRPHLYIKDIHYFHFTSHGW